MKPGVGQLMDNRINFSEKYNTNVPYSHQQNDIVKPLEQKEGKAGSASKPASLVRNNVGNIPTVNMGAPGTNGVLVSKDEIFQKNKTFNYPKESSTTRGEQLGVESRRQRSSKAPQHMTTETAQHKQPAVGEGHYTP